MVVGSLFAGIGGFDLAARWMGWRTAWFSEIEPYASQVLAKHWPDVPNHGDITQIQGDEVEGVDLLCGGFPCQDISIAGKGAGIDGERSGLWSHYARLIDELRPSWVVAENVSALRSRGLGRVLKDLDALGYDAEWHCVSASAVGAPHQRDRVWIVAYPNRVVVRELPRGRRGEGRQGADVTRGDGPRRRVAAAAHTGTNTDIERLEGRNRFFLPERPGQRVTGALGASESGRLPFDPWWKTEPDVGRVVDGVPARMDRLRALGNAVVPQVVEYIGRRILEAEGLT